MSQPLTLLLLSVSLTPAVAPPSLSPTAHGDRLRDQYFRAQALLLADRSLAEIKSKADWQEKAPRLREQFLDMMGLWPLPRRTDLHATLVGKVETPAFTVEKIHFQSWPGLYVSANLYLPRNVTKPCPAVLYVCGHGPTVIDKVPYGNKVTYQHHPAWFAENGYVCLILDTLQLGELPGLHHGTSRFDMWWWVSLGYTPAGIELWNAMRGIDYLQSRKEVDPKRIGVTGRSGGGATSWWVGAADPRVQCIIPVAGIADLLAHVSEGYPGRLGDGVVAGHCDCMYMVNTYRWDYTMVMALCAPRALLLGNSDQDVIFPIPGYRRMATKVKKLYELLEAGDRFELLETKGPHKDTPELRLGAFRWMNRWLKEDDRPVQEPDRPRLDPKQLKVFTRPPTDALNDIVHERFRKPATLDLPDSPKVLQGWWPGKSRELLTQLRERVFRGWPSSPPDLAAKQVAEHTSQGIRIRALEFQSEENFPLRVWLVESSNVDRPREILATVVDESDWQQWLEDLGPQFRQILHQGGNPAPHPYPQANEARFKQHRQTMERYRWAFAIVAPRGVGPTRWSDRSRFDDKPAAHQIKRRFYLLGQTWEGQQVWDTRRAVQALRSIDQYKDIPLTLQGRGERGVIGLYAALFEPTVSALELWHPPSSHRQGPTFLNVLTVLDTPQAVGLFLPRKLTLHTTETASKSWEWSRRLAQALGSSNLQLKIVDE